MNQKEWKTSEKYKDKYEWYNKTRKLQRSLCYESDPNANIIHHLRDTEEQRKYNDEHYELWGHNLDGTFEYGKYVVFWTKEKHDQYHAQSEETRKKNSKGVKASITSERRKRMSEVQSGENNSMYGKRGKLAPCYGRCGELHPMYGKCHTDKAKEQIKYTMNILKSEYRKYKEGGGTLKWNKFMKELSVFKKTTNTNSKTVNYNNFINQLTDK